jgi:MerR family transcriptional regulator, thiopeptide resistance regulator
MTGRPGEPSKARPVASSCTSRNEAELLQAFHGGDRGIERSLHRMWSEEDPAELSRGAMDRELAAYMGAVMRAKR